MNKTTRNKQKASEIPAAAAASARDKEKEEEKEKQIKSSSLPDDAILHILSMLHVKSVLRFRPKPLSAVKAEVSKIWELKNEVTISIHNHTSFIFDFENSDDCKWVLGQDSTIYISKSLFVIRPCSPLIQKNLSDLETIPIWVLIHGVPLHMWNNKGLGMISSYLGVPLMADDITINMTRLSYARVWVVIDLDFDYPSHKPLLIDHTIEMELPVKYQFKPPKCDGCKTFGHSPSNCPKRGHEKKGKAIWIPKTNLLANKEQLNRSRGGSRTMENGGNCSNENLEEANEGLNVGVIDNLTRRMGKISSH
ncbi:uncharacterized protein LOC113287022 [Papaver somniferum]|uniref:uncharacterized protein LOC113287022 n=1 Tax=Papaver somniferum TaxID=3469 RepID=UPI000E6FE8B7|nr:uncharacterized protein LOC113287022 [Papaver somniferum]